MKQGFIEPTEIIYLNGTKQTIFETSDVYTDQQYSDSTFKAGIYMNISPRKHRIEEYLLYQPNNTTRTLSYLKADNPPQESINFVESTTSKESEEYQILHTLHILALIGGFYSFLNLMFGTITCFINDTFMKMEFINQIKSKISNSKVAKMGLYKEWSPKDSKVMPVNLLEETKGMIIYILCM